MASQSYASQNLPLPTEYGAWLRGLRQQNDVVQRTLAAAANMDSSHLGKVERGERLPTSEQATALAKFLGVDLVEMRSRLVAARLMQECDGDYALAHTAAGLVQEAAAPYLVNNPVNKAANRKAKKK